MVAGRTHPSNALSFRNLGKSNLGGVIFECKTSTMKECLVSQLFGLTAHHFSYVNNIIPGLPLFLFNCSNRLLHGIFEATSSGQMNINPYGWTSNGSDRTFYPAQVQIRTRLQCQPLTEDQFKPIIIDNYYNSAHFWFELDHAQTCRLMSKFSTAVVTAPTSLVPQSTAKWIAMVPDNKKRQETEASNNPLVLRGNLTNSPDSDYPQEVINNEEAKDIIYMKLKGLAERNLECSDAPKRDCVGGDLTTGSEEKSEEESLPAQISWEKSESYSGSSFGLCNPGAIIGQLLAEIQERRTFQVEQMQKMKHMEHKLHSAEREIIQLKSKVMILESKSNTDIHLDFDESIFLVGGFDGFSWLSGLDLYCPSQDVLKYLKPMDCTRSYSSVVKFNGELYVVGGGNGSEWYDTVESYDPIDNKWSLWPSLNEKKGSLGGAALDNKIYAVGGGNGTESLSNVEMYDINVGRWIQTRSMLQKRFAVAAVELNGALYAVGGYDGHSYLESAERFDPREHSWSSISSMSVKRSCHSLLVMNEKLYALGGFDGSAMTPTVEIYEPRMGKWYSGSSMSQPRGYLAAAVLKDLIYVIGGVNTANGDIIELIECYKEEKGWQTTNLKGAGKRCFSSAIVLGGD